MENKEKILTLKRNKIIVHLCGGCAANLCEKAIKELRFLGEGFAEFEFSFIDTSRNNYDSIEQVGPLFEIKRKATSLKTEISGSGGDRAQNAYDAMLNIPDYLESLRITKRETGVYHLVVSSASGGSGSIISAFLVETLMQKNIPVIALMVGDSSDALKLRNTQSSLSTLSKKAVSMGKCLLTHYINNADMGSSLTGNEDKANAKIKSALTILALFLSGQNDDIDQADMNNFINQHDYKGLSIPAGIYTLSYHSGNTDITLPDYTVPSVARTLRVGNEDVNFNLDVLHHKVGRILSENAINIMDNNLPVHIVASNGLLKEEMKRLTEANEKSAQRQKDLVNCNLEAAKHAVYDDELGIDL